MHRQLGFAPRRHASPVSGPSRLVAPQAPGLHVWVPPVTPCQQAPPAPAAAGGRQDRRDPQDPSRSSILPHAQQRSSAAPESAMAAAQSGSTADHSAASGEPWQQRQPQSRTRQLSRLRRASSVAAAPAEPPRAGPAAEEAPAAAAGPAPEAAPQAAGSGGLPHWKPAVQHRSPAVEPAAPAAQQPQRGARAAGVPTHASHLPAVPLGCTQRSVAQRLGHGRLNAS